MVGNIKILKPFLVKTFQIVENTTIDELADFLSSIGYVDISISSCGVNDVYAFIANYMASAHSFTRNAIGVRYDDWLVVFENFIFEEIGLMVISDKTFKCMVDTSFN